VALLFFRPFQFYRQVIDLTLIRIILLSFLNINFSYFSCFSGSNPVDSEFFDLADH